MTNRFVRKQSCLICLVIALLILSLAGTGQAEPINTSADIGQARAQIVSLVKEGKFDEADKAVEEIIALPVSQEKGAALQQIGGEYQMAKQYDRAIKICDYVLQNWPKEDFAIWAGKSLAFSQIGKGDLTAAESTTEHIIADCANNANLPEALSAMAENYGWQKMYEKAERLYRLVIDKSPDSPIAAKARIGMAGMKIMALIERQNFSLALQEINSMAADFNDQQNLPEMMFRIGQGVYWQRQYGESKQVFDILADRFPDSSFGKQAKLWSARANACALIRQAKDEQALAAVDKMISDFNGDAGLPEAVYGVSQELEWTKGKVGSETTRYDTPTTVYQRLAQQLGDSSYGRQAQWDQKRMAHRAKIFKLISTGDQNEIDSAIEQMVADFAGHPEFISEELHWVAIGYEQNCKPGKAMAMDERIATEFPDGNEAEEAILDAIRVAIEIEERTDAKGVAEQVITDIRRGLENTPRLASALYTVGDAYRGHAEIYERIKADAARSRVCLEKAVELYNEVIRLAGDSDPAPKAYLRLADCLRKSQKIQDALNCYTEIKNKWPATSGFEEGILSGTAKCYEELGRQGQISQNQADANLEPAYKGLVAKFPERLDTPQTLLKLGWLNFRQNKWQDGIGWFEKGLEKFPKGNRPADILYAAGRYYQKSGQTDKAIAMYEELRQALPAGKQLDEISTTLDQLKN